ncbi:hypothetical protein V2H29_02060 [Lysinibacillus fusiformis]|uniref:hypothetical protein n=1 Tax=Lysinibacillus TaxID=400634 RepID=UPI00232F9955|nr:hypothetical protein [Lysinibacillus sp. OF-1]MEE3805730.1 hypothetical protein [Lysinibacillus fusiformis]WCH46566.1 hypothetical protein NV349_15920 [Lysinibacillus sp. OF-1]
MSKFGIDELIQGAIKTFEGQAYHFDNFFEQGNTLEILSNSGKNYIDTSIFTTIQSALNDARETSRKLLIEKNIVASLEKKGRFGEEINKNLSERAKKLQVEYEESYKEVSRLENLLFNYEK